MPSTSRWPSTRARRARSTPGPGPASSGAPTAAAAGARSTPAWASPFSQRQRAGHRPDHAEHALRRDQRRRLPEHQQRRQLERGQHRPEQPHRQRAGHRSRHAHGDLHRRRWRVCLRVRAVSRLLSVSDKLCSPGQRCVRQLPGSLRRRLSERRPLRALYADDYADHHRHPDRHAHADDYADTDDHPHTDDHAHALEDANADSPRRQP